ncbi:threonine ammonia-lyase [Flammeovirga kamogawensis]|uniref:L-threonine dehydratase n=1 Tax=Flammeovirga kamogawensis TaxID=373891 RepID=A0ABX8GVK6_9BACT|nr:threonine ammonia-lyase [Flammeovirga kamogawensis]MBB6459971.1 threonine dehydratase [Flammeovirga kamogawensis]QWG06980.1 threonine ammonia-lyase [Flammeovirga kamogawensis]TRX68800.1 threonine ammonia-lyase [Flammeovirga kamogawensis]
MQETEEFVDLPSVESIVKAHRKLKDVVTRTPLMRNLNLSERYQADIWLKREDLQIVRSYKLRGAFNKISSLDKEEQKRGIVCASAGNHAQGVAYSCKLLGIHGVIYMPAPTPKQKVSQVRMWGKDKVEVVLIGDTFDDAYAAAMKRCEEEGRVFIHPFDDPKVIEGQGTVGLEILEDAKEEIDYLVMPIGGGGLSSGVGSYFQQISPATKIYGVEPEGAPAMKESIIQDRVVTLDKIEKFVDGAAVQRVGDNTFRIAKQFLEDVILVPEGKVCSTILRLYNEDAIVVEPAGALSISALDAIKDEIKGKKVVCVVSGSNNDIGRMEEIKQRSLIYEGYKHYFMIRFPQRAGALREYLIEILGPNDDICHFEYTKKVNREKAPAIVGIEVKSPEDFDALMIRMEKRGYKYELLNENEDMFHFLI